MRFRLFASYYLPLAANFKTYGIRINFIARS